MEKNIRATKTLKKLLYYAKKTKLILNINKNIIKNFKIEELRILWNDLNKYNNFSFKGDHKCVNSIEYIPTFLNIWYHSIEKGLSLGENAKLGFGKNKIIYLLRLLENFEKLNSCDKEKKFQKNSVILSAISAIANYKEFHLKRSFNLDPTLIVEIDKVLDTYAEVNIRPSIRLYESMGQFLNDNFPYVIKNRRSVRNFKIDLIPDILKVRSAVELALNCPTACNRQPFKVRIIQDNSLINRLTLVQGGTAGFNCVPTLLVITFYRRFYHNLIERHSGFIDTGIYIMNLVYSLISVELDSCVLNNAFNNNKEKEIRNILGDVEKDEEFVAFVAVGYGMNNSFVPASNKSSIPIKEY